MTAAETDTSTTTNALNVIMSLVTERRTLIQFEIAEKSSRTYRIKAPSWRAAKEMIDDTHHNAGMQTFHDSYDDDCYFEVDGGHYHIADYRPTLDQKIKQVKIGYEWDDLQQIVWDPEYHLETDNINDALWEKYPNGVDLE